MTREEKKYRRRWTLAAVMVVLLLLAAWAVALWAILGAAEAKAETLEYPPSVAALDEHDAAFTEAEENALIENALKLRSEKIERCKVTHYCACVRCCSKSDGITASGLRAVQGVTCAADDIPLGATVMVDYDGDGLIDQYLVCQDRFGGGETNHIDIYMDDHQEALEAGVKYATVWWCEEET